MEKSKEVKRVVDLWEALSATIKHCNTQILANSKFFSFGLQNCIGRSNCLATLWICFVQQ